MAAALATVLGADLVLAWLQPRWILGGALDEPAHLATGAIVLAHLPPAGPAWSLGYAIGCVGVDVDHLPLIPVRHKLRKGTPRPPLHTLLAPAALAAAAGYARGRTRETLLGAAVGTCAHFFRDVATGSGLAPFQPLVRRRAKLPYKVYGAATALLAVRASRLGRRDATLCDGL